MPEDETRDNRIDALVAKATTAGYLAKKDVEGAFGPKEGHRVREVLDILGQLDIRSRGGGRGGGR